jgi:hypothetical protein
MARTERETPGEQGGRTEREVEEWALARQHGALAKQDGALETAALCTALYCTERETPRRRVRPHSGRSGPILYRREGLESHPFYRRL